MKLYRDIATSHSIAYEVVVILTGMRSAYFCRIRSASALRFSNGCSSLNLERIFAEYVGYVRMYWSASHYR